MSLAQGMNDEVTVVIPGHDCEKTLPQCLWALAQFVKSGQVSEVIFVNDASVDESEEVARRAGARVLQCPGRGPGAARNLGWRAARTSLIWFVDADCVPEPEALTLLLEARTAIRAQAVGGSYANAQSSSFVARLIHEEMVLRHLAIGPTSNFAITANLLCETAVLEQLNGFDESLKLAQDLDLAYRIDQAGHILGFQAESRVAHFHETSFLAYLKKQARQGYWRMQLYAKHPHRVTGDRYSGVLDYAQPPVAILALGLGLGTVAAKAVRGLAFPSLLLGAASTGAVAGLVLLQLPMAGRLLRRSPLEALAYVPFGSFRALARGLGMCCGLFVVITPFDRGKSKLKGVVPRA